jgi:hypothetical protein
MNQVLYPNMSVIGSIFWPTAGTLATRVLQEIDQQYYQGVKSCQVAQDNINRLTDLLGATDPNSGEVAADYVKAYQVTIPKLQAWMANNNCSTLTTIPGTPSSIDPAITPPAPTTSKSSNLLLPILLAVGGIVLIKNRNKKKRRK